MADADAKRAAEVAALERELRGYEVRGLDDRAAQVKARLRALGAGVAAEKPKAGRRRTTSKARKTTEG